MKKLIKILIPVILLLAVLRFFFPPLTELGFTTTQNDIGLQVSINARGGIDPVKLYIEDVAGIDQAAVSLEICVSLVGDMESGSLPITGLNETGEFEITFIGGGRYFYRFAKGRVLRYSYGPDGCALVETANG